jgi:hypothetical protein
MRAADRHLLFRIRRGRARRANLQQRIINLGSEGTSLWDRPMFELTLESPQQHGVVPRGLEQSLEFLNAVVEVGPVGHGSNLRVPGNTRNAEDDREVPFSARMRSPGHPAPA